MNLLELFAPIRTFVFDLDGVLTDGSLMFINEGLMPASVNTKDLYAIQQARKKGYTVLLITEYRSEPTRRALCDPGIVDVHFGIENKKEFIEKLIATRGSSSDSILYMGNDIPAYAALQVCGLPCCPNDAVPEIKQVSKYISPFSGGRGCVRDVIEKTLKLNGDWQLPT